MHSVAYLIGNLNKEHGGAQKLLYDICNNIDNDQFNQTVYYMFGEGTFTDDFQATGASVVCLKANSNYDIFAFKKFIKFLTETNPDILHTNSPISGIWGRSAGKIAGVDNIVSVEHSIHTEYPRLTQIGNGATLPLADAIVGVSHAVSNSYFNWERFIIPESTALRTIQNGVDMQEIENELTDSNSSLKKHTPFHPTDKIIGTVGRLKKAKGYKYLLESFTKIKHRHPGAKLLIVGDGPMRQELENLAYNTSWEDSVFFTGYIQNVYPLLPNFDIAVFPSLWEGLPIAPAEAMVAKRPIVATRIQPFEELINESGILVEPANSEALAVAVSNLLDNPQKRSDLGSRSRQRICEKFTIERTVREYTQLYKELINNE